MNSTQLKFFSEPATGNLYKAGDWIKVRKKPAIAAWVKRGEIFQINAVSPKDGSIRFWNPYIDQWDFLYPDEIKLTVEPVVGEVPRLNVESVVGEVPGLTVEPVVGEVPGLTVEPVVGEVPRLTVESVVGEVPGLTVEPVVGEVPRLTVESVVGEVPGLTVEPVVGEVPGLTVEPVVGEVPRLTVESVVGEVAGLTVEPVVGEVAGLTVEPVVGEVKNCNSGNAYGWIETHYKIRINGKQRSLTCPEIGCTGPYYSYRWMDGKRQRTKYCPAKKLPAVNRALQLGRPVNEILEIISSQ